MGVRGNQELLEQLPAAVAAPAAAAVAALAELQAVRHMALGPEEVLALGELWERFTAQVASGRLGLLAAIDARDDVIPKAKAGDAGTVFAHHVLGQRRAVARRDGLWAALLRPEVGDLPAIGAAFAAGDVSAAHVEVAVRAHRDLGARVRDAFVECEVPDADTGLAAALSGLSDAFTARVRQIRVVDVLLAHYARSMSVTELEALAQRIVRTLNPPDAKGAHERRFLAMSQLPGGGWVGRFECGPAQGLIIRRAIAAGCAPRPGTAIDPDGVEHQLPDLRDLGARQIDALTDIAAAMLTRNGIALPTDHTTPSPKAADTTGTGAGTDADDASHHTSVDFSGNAQGRSGAPSGDRFDDSTVDLVEPPAGEGEAVVLREPGVLVGPYPAADLVLVAGIEHVAAAFTQRPHALPLNVQHDFNAWMRDRFSSRFRCAEQAEEQAERQAAEQQAAEQQAAEQQAAEQQAAEQQAAGQQAAGQQAAEQQAAGQQAAGETPSGERSREQRRAGLISPDQESLGNEPPEGSAPTGREGPAGRCDCQRERRDGDLGWLGRALSPYGVPARVEHAGPVDATTLELLACTATVRAALLAPNGALLDLGRSQRLASPRQKTALLARDGGCVIPGCTVPGDACDAHHVQWWSRGGPTNLDNLVLLCGRHHTEVHQEIWHIQMRHGIPWVIPPSWMNPHRPLLRNAAHHPRDHGREAA